MRSARPVLVWFRQDLRLADNPALLAAADSGQPVVPLYVLDDETPASWTIGGAARWWLHHSLKSLARDLALAGASLVLRRGDSRAVLPDLVRQTGASVVFWNRRAEPFAIQTDDDVAAALARQGVRTRSFDTVLLHPPGSVATRSGEPFRVFTAFWRAVLAKGEPPQPAPPPAKLRGLESVQSDDLDGWGLTPRRPNWAAEFPSEWTPGEAGAQARLDAFLAAAAHAYPSDRDRPDRASTSRLSPHLHWGEISPRAVWHGLRTAEQSAGLEASKFLTELGWREFSAHLLLHNPELPDTCLRPEFSAFPWADDRTGFEAWRTGTTGYPIVDAGMRQLWRTGWMHNRVRMVAASFLVKHLLIPWQTGARWFWDTLVDADLASNSASWQWVAGCGADAAPFFRIFNPVLQGAKFDPDGAYVRRFVPELAGLPASVIHAPWQAPRSVLAKAGVRLGETYPEPIVDHASARRRALAAFQSLSNRRRPPRPMEDLFPS